ncbi:MAG: hypothetical protein A3C30_02730 [Candidatus Levybacteria bacterium RIFCSPHIGHO2_02_FULL_40_18]|nr:MAG: hypothetical protein A2869_05245 [Candidatus Levybacteria bacterium RIFCSPHIGHO2_01_FULL_40_58]OGH26891.1 MAG: hypothetical protein A3C30_02730 [Candidatus Levybacteria bacterium RIFCSPHIGHO2_02_FULL_40_18]OGH32013.1 MAG: hypothetical protein A3E43_03710 [Candidatus Levybacteria bacterium RIFCSPHIGHO2_12_FULL_40_31]OGH40865.1 MAG: hypothetical protein A2894_04690 [Candidatus Levybacteria bacterium RIFCSPLOWO2_01_FULL_40_64]OGH49562.1 MAG: hypothetical protein A3I54_00255 [Candidatus Lev
MNNPMKGFPNELERLWAKKAIEILRTAALYLVVALVAIVIFIPTLLYSIKEVLTDRKKRKKRT